MPGHVKIYAADFKLPGHLHPCRPNYFYSCKEFSHANLGLGKKSFRSRSLSFFREFMSMGFVTDSLFESNGIIFTPRIKKMTSLF